MDENPEYFQHSPSGDAGKPQDHCQHAPGLSRVSQSSAGLDIHHELVIYCFILTMRSLTGAGSVLRPLHILACVLLSLMVVRFRMFNLDINNFWNILFTLSQKSISVI